VPWQLFSVFTLATLLIGCATATAGRTYFFRARASAKAKDIQVFTVFSPLGGLVADAATYNDRQGPIDLIPISEAEARQAIAAAR
jgi:hypothetical protein